MHFKLTNKPKRFLPPKLYVELKVKRRGREAYNVQLTPTRNGKATFKIQPHSWEYALLHFSAEDESRYDHPFRITPPLQISIPLTHRYVLFQYKMIRTVYGEYADVLDIEIPDMKKMIDKLEYPKVEPPTIQKFIQNTFNSIGTSIDNLLDSIGL